MKISIDNIELFTLSETQKKVIQNEIDSSIFHEDIKRRIQYVVMHKYEQCFKRLKAEWDKKLLENGVESVPTNSDKYAELVFTQSNYKNRSQRDLESTIIGG